MKDIGGEEWERNVGQSLRLVMCDLVNKEDAGPDTMQ